MLGPADVLDCSGDHHGMGLAQGRTGQVAGQAVWRAFLTSPELELARPAWLPRPLFPPLARWQARRALEGSVREVYPEQAARMEGIAAGLGLSLGTLYMGLSAELLLNEVHWLPGACSALGVRGRRTADGEALIAKNFDYPPSFRVGFCVRRNQPAQGYRSLDVTVVPLAGCHSGVNEAGLAVTYNYGYAQETAERPLPITLLIQRMLERCRTVAEAVELARATPRAGGALLTLADAAGELIALELGPRQLAVRPAEDDQVACANHYLTPSLAALDVPHDAVYGPRSIPALRGERVHRSSEARLAELRRLAGESGVDADALEAVLRDHGAEGGPGSDLTICRHGDYYRTTCSVVLLPARRALRVSFDSPCQARFVEHALDAAVPAA